MTGVVTDNSRSITKTLAVGARSGYKWRKGSDILGIRTNLDFELVTPLFGAGYCSAISSFTRKCYFTFSSFEIDLERVWKNIYTRFKVVFICDHVTYILIFPDVNSSSYHPFFVTSNFRQDAENLLYFIRTKRLTRVTFIYLLITGENRLAVAMN